MKKKLVLKPDYFENVIHRSWMRNRRQHFRWIRELETCKPCLPDYPLPDLDMTAESYNHSIRENICSIMKRLLSVNEVDEEDVQGVRVSNLFAAIYLTYEHWEHSVPLNEDLAVNRRKLWMRYFSSHPNLERSSLEILKQYRHATDCFEYHFFIIIAFRISKKIESYDKLLDWMAAFVKEIRTASETKSSSSYQHQDSKKEFHPYTNNKFPAETRLEEIVMHSVKRFEDKRKEGDTNLLLLIGPIFRSYLSKHQEPIEYLAHQIPDAVNNFLCDEGSGSQFADFFEFPNHSPMDIWVSPFESRHHEIAVHQADHTRRDALRDEARRRGLWLSTQQQDARFVNERPLHVDHPNMRERENSAFVTPVRARALAEDLF